MKLKINKYIEFLKNELSRLERAAKRGDESGRLGVKINTIKSVINELEAIYNENKEK